MDKIRVEYEITADLYLEMQLALYDGAPQIGVRITSTRIMIGAVALVAIILALYYMQSTAGRMAAVLIAAATTVQIGTMRRRYRRAQAAGIKSYLDAGLLKSPLGKFALEIADGAVTMRGERQTMTARFGDLVGCLETERAIMLRLDHFHGFLVPKAALGEGEREFLLGLAPGAYME